MGQSIDQQVIDFVANYYGVSSSSISSSTTFSSLGTNTISDLIKMIQKCEDNFGLIYETGDENGIITVGDLIALINRKLGGGDS